MRERVLLFPGLGEMPIKMAMLSGWLRLSGYQTEVIDYPSTTARAEALISDYFKPALKSREHLPTVHCVTNSLGGVLLRGLFAKRVPPNLGRVVMIAPGHKGSATLEHLRLYPIANMLFGPILQQSGDGVDAYANQLPKKVHFSLGIIAGNLGLDPFAYGLAPTVQDGRVTLASTKVEGMQDHIALPVPHELLAHHPLVAMQTIAFLQHGHFINSEFSRSSVPHAKAA